MRSTFSGHAAFLIETSGARVITDPYSSSIGYLPIDDAADLVTLSHDNPKWNYNAKTASNSLIPYT